MGFVATTSGDRNMADRVRKNSRIFRKRLDIGLMSNYIDPMKTNHIISLVSRIRDKASRLIIHELNTRNISGLAPSHGDILVLLFHSGTVSMREIAQKIGRDKSTVTALVKKLIDFGYVQKEPDRNDSRVTRIKLTKPGRALREDFDEISKTLLQRVYKGFTEKEKEVMVHGLERINRNL
jgi:DNA-binding MarR family transcriptional regulator